MRIGELSRATGISIPTIRLYEREGLIEPALRTEGKFREFTPQQKRRLDFIKRTRNLGFSLDDVKALLALEAAQDEVAISEVIHRVCSGIASRKNDLNRLENALKDASPGRASLIDLENIF